VISLLQLRDAVALAGVVELQALSRQFNVSSQLLTALLERLIALGKVEKVPETTVKRDCFGCIGCGQAPVCQRRCYYRYVA
jgi:ferrous iron transport protein C